MEMPVTFARGLPKAAALTVCECASILGGIVGALIYLGLWKAMLRSWDLQGVGQITGLGALFGVVVGIPLTILMSITVFKSRSVAIEREWTYWAVACLFLYGIVGSFLICIFLFAWAQ
jgi:hypothetical protein